jgi:hypothetical protein
MWLEEVDPKTHESRPAEISGIWLIYAEGDEPYALLMCSRTAPLEMAISDLATIYRLATPLRPRDE